MNADDFSGRTTPLPEPDRPLTCAVMGAGAVGGYYGGMLARAGHAVTLVARPAHVQAIRSAGLRLQTATFDEHIPLLATPDASGVASADVVLCCVKSTDTEAAGAALRPHLADHAVVLSLQNGVDNAQRLADVLGRPVVPAVVYVATAMAGPGHVVHHGRGELVVGPFEGSARLQAQFAVAHIPVDVSDHVQEALWAKLIVNCAYNALSAISQLPYGELVRQPGVWDTMRDVVQECLAVAAADGVTPTGDAWASVEQIAHSMAGQRSSTAQDLARGKPTEIDHLNGYVVRRATAHGLPAPVNRLLQTLVHCLETPVTGLRQSPHHA